MHKAQSTSLNKRGQTSGRWSLHVASRLVVWNGLNSSVYYRLGPISATHNPQGRWLVLTFFTFRVVVGPNCVSRLVTACTVVQAVVKATSQSNGKGQIWPMGLQNPERISMKLGIYNRVASMPTHANPCGAATTWVVWANTWNNTCRGFLGIPF